MGRVASTYFFHNFSLSDMLYAVRDPHNIRALRESSQAPLKKDKFVYFYSKQITKNKRDCQKKPPRRLAKTFSSRGTPIVRATFHKGKQSSDW